MSVTDVNGKLWVSHSGSLYEEGADDPGYLDVVIEESEGQVATITATRRQLGLQRVIQGSDTQIHVSWSPTGDRAGARRIAVGRVEAPPSGLLSSTQVVTAICGPLNLDERLLEYAKYNLSDTIEVDRLFADFDESDPQSYLLTRTGVYYVDPADHDVGRGIDVVDELRGDRRLDLSDVAILDGGRVTEVSQNEFGVPARTLRGRCTVEWTQSASGRHTIRQGITTLDPGVASDPMSAVVFLESDGWTLNTDHALHVTEWVDTGYFDSGTRYLVTHNDTKNTSSVTVPGQVKLRSWYVAYNAIKVGWAISRDRREIVEAELEVPLVGQLGRSTDEVVEFSLVDVFEELGGTQEWQPNRAYSRGEKVLFGGRRYSASVDHYSTTFDAWSGETRYTEVEGLPFYEKLPIWNEVASDPDDLTPSSPSFFATSMGRAVGDAIMRRLARDGRRRLRCLRVSARLTWADAEHVTLRHEVTLKAWDGTRYYLLTGKVCRIRRVWPAAGTPFVEIEVGVAFGGDGRLSSGPIEQGEGAYVAPGFVIAGYDAGVSSGSRYHGSLTSAVDRYFRVPIYDPVAEMQQPGQVRTLRSENDHRAQTAVARLIAARGGDVRKCTSERPTRIFLGMKPIATTGAVEKVFKPKATLLDAPCGIA